MSNKDVYLRLNLAPKQLAPALVGRPEGGLRLRELRQLSDELDILETIETFPIPNIDRENLSEPRIREIIVEYDFRTRGFFYGVRDYAIHQLGSDEISRGPGWHLGTKTTAVAEASYTSLDLWRDRVPLGEKGMPDFIPYEK